MRAIEQLVAEGLERPKPALRGRPPRVYTADGEEVFITLRCPSCRQTKPLSKFGLRRMGNGQIRNAPWCKRCRGGTRIHVETRRSA